MSATNPLYQNILQRITETTDLTLTARKRFALLVSGIVAAHSAVIAKAAAEILALGLTKATDGENVARTLRRALDDDRLQPQTCYQPALKAVLDWPKLLRGSNEITISIDESSCADKTHLLRASLCYWGGTLPLAWRIWPQNVPQAAGHYCQQIDALLAALAEIIPPGVQVLIVADRAYAVPNFIDRVQAYNWHWLLRLTTTGSHRLLDERGREHELRQVVRKKLKRAGQRFKMRGKLFKDAGWREASIVGMWSAGSKESLVVISDLPAHYVLLHRYERRFWIECGFRNDKSRGWEWEQSQVEGQHQAVLLLALAWASLIALCVGVEQAEHKLAAEQHKRARGDKQGKPRQARESIFLLGLRAVRRWLYSSCSEPLPWRLSELDSVSWQQRWHACQSRCLVFSPTALAA